MVPSTLTFNLGVPLIPIMQRVSCNVQESLSEFTHTCFLWNSLLRDTCAHFLLRQRVQNTAARAMSTPHPKDRPLYQAQENLGQMEHSPENACHPAKNLYMSSGVAQHNWEHWGASVTPPSLVSHPNEDLWCDLDQDNH